MSRFISFFITFVAFALFANTAQAASLFFTPGSGEYGIGKEIVVDLKIDSEGAGVNAAQATLRFPNNTLEVKSIDKADSVFSFWLEEPTYSNTDGIISFVGGTPYGISGASLQVLHIVFTTKGSGVAPLSIVDSAVTASDGSGTNVLSKTADASFTISPTKTTAVPLAPPTQITRVPEQASGLPVKPSLNVPLYLDPTAWYNKTNVFTAFWELPRDVSGVATALNKQPNTTPETNEGLFENKAFPTLTDGVWYLHVRFKNEIGWGPTTHYRIAIDTKAPIGFDVTSLESEVGNNPSPTLKFKTSDALSGIKEYQIKVDSADWTVVPTKDFSGEHRVYLSNPGKHRVIVRAIDNAGNSIETEASYETIPLPAPTFTFVTETLFSDEDTGLSFKGTALPETEIILSLKKGEALVASKIVSVDAQGNWEIALDDPLRNGTYVASIQNRDMRGALSLPVSSRDITVTGRYSNLVSTIMVILVIIILGGYLFYRNRHERTKLRIQVAETDTEKAFNIIKTSVQKLKETQKTSTTADDEFVIKKLETDIERLGSYAKDEIARARKD